jgi:hypothetical protein
MQNSFKRSIFGPAVALVTLLANGFISLSIAAKDEISMANASKPHFLLRVNLNEFSVLNVAEMDGVLKYGGSGDFKLNMAKEESNVVWNVTVDNPRIMELLGIFVGEKTMKLIQSLDPNKIDANQKIALQAIKSLSLKLEEAQKNPLWDSIKLSGTVSQDGTNWVLQSKEDKFKLVGDKLAELESRSGRPVVADGFVKTPGQFEVTRFKDQKTNTLELFGMSFCPFGQRAEMTLFDFLDGTNVSARPNLEIHYIFYKHDKDGKEVFSSLHGESEILEDLVQITIRDNYAEILPSYLRLRASERDAAWPKLAERLGLSQEQIAQIKESIVSNRDWMIRQEYDYVAGQCEIKDGSPSYLWESEKVADLRKVEAFKGIAARQDSCSN